MLMKYLINNKLIVKNEERIVWCFNENKILLFKTLLYVRELFDAEVDPI